MELSNNVLDHTGEYVDADEAPWQIAQAARFRKRLREMDPSLDVVYFGPEATVVPHPDRFYIVRRRALTVDTYWVVQDENQNFCVPDQRHIDKLMESDLTKQAVWEDIEKARVAKEKAKEKRKKAKSDEFQEKLLERLNHVYDARIAVPNVEVRQGKAPVPIRKTAARG